VGFHRLIGPARFLRRKYFSLSLHSAAEMDNACRQFRRLQTWEPTKSRLFDYDPRASGDEAEATSGNIPMCPLRGVDSVGRRPARASIQHISPGRPRQSDSRSLELFPGTQPWRKKHGCHVTLSVEKHKDGPPSIEVARGRPRLKCPGAFLFFLVGRRKSGIGYTLPAAAVRLWSGIFLQKTLWGVPGWGRSRTTSGSQVDASVLHDCPR